MNISGERRLASVVIGCLNIKMSPAEEEKMEKLGRAVVFILLQDKRPQEHLIRL
jgi:hypothetical protein